ncbi:SMI1/KNR4 family protein [Massilia violaceinigra]|uniref:SMI1/KNR4 family protein n=1 Tax=Massilia violaceinigra TaxID=2045208 RepID=A0ABY4A4F3_9BURK|nr:SMI1/KNR4 family protein [Massilia violaceinigra]UOD29242.1 SMI1/KNR4 family protein [Massilia violaceinigra]
MLTRDQIEELNERLVRIPDEDENEEEDEDEDDWYELVFSEPDSAQDIAALEEIIGFAVPEPLKALYQQCGAFKHASHCQAWNTVQLYPVSTLLTWLRADPGTKPAVGLLAYIHDVWGRRTELDVIDAESAKIINENYIVFGERCISDDVYEYWYFDRNGLFGSLYFDQDQGAYNVWKLETLVNIIPPDSMGLSPEERRACTLAEIATVSSDENIFPGKELDALITQQFDDCAQRLAEG